MATITGGCLCGKIRYSTDAAPKFVSLCHCRDCQKFTGSAFSAVIAWPKAAVAVTGTPKGFAKHGDSGKPIERFFCPDCGASIMDEAAAVPGLVMIAAARSTTRAGSSRHRRSIAPARSPGSASMRRPR